MTETCDRALECRSNNLPINKKKPIMKLKPLLVIALFFLALATSAKETIIKGKINGKLPKTLYYSAPVNGAMGFDRYYTANVDVQGDFEIKTNLFEISFIDIYYNYQPAGAIIATPGNTYNINITESEGKVSHRINSKDTEAQKLYDTILNDHRESLFFELSLKLEQHTSAAALNEDAQFKESMDIAAITKLYKANAISKELFTVMKKERSYFYASCKAYAVICKHISADRSPIATDLSEFDMLWKDIYTKHSPFDLSAVHSPWANYFFQYYKVFKIYESVGFNGKKIKSEKGFKDAESNLAPMPEPSAEYYAALSIFGRTFGTQKDKAVITQFSDFKNKYPKSGFTKYLEPMIAPVLAFYTNNDSLPAGAAFIENYSEIKSVAELIKKFPNQKLYFDTWATWCAPCRDEFKYKHGLYKLLKENNITIVYISIDKDDKDETWKKMISSYELEGHHIRANKLLESDFIKLYNDNGTIAIPWYLLVGKDGKIKYKRAASASELDKLEEQIKTL
jgi:thiol-disulfide isomerase/thioredoxin